MKMGVVETKGEESGVESCTKTISDLLGTHVVFELV